MKVVTQREGLQGGEKKRDDDERKREGKECQVEDTMRGGKTGWIRQASIRRVDWRLDGGIVGREKVVEEKWKPLEELLGELQIDPCLATEDEQVGDVCSTSKYILIGEMSVYRYVCLYISHMRVGFKEILFTISWFLPLTPFRSISVSGLGLVFTNC